MPRRRWKPAKVITSIEFQVVANLGHGQMVCLAGNHPRLGNLQPDNAIRLVTTPDLHPMWYTHTTVSLEEGTELQYAYCVRTGGRFDRWETINEHRSLTIDHPSVLRGSIRSSNRHSY